MRCGALFWVVLAAADAAGHPFHVTIAEGARDAETGRLEIAMRVWPEDLDRLLDAHAGRDIDLDDRDALPEPMTAFLRETFVLHAAGDRPADGWTPPRPREGEPEPPPPILWRGLEFEGAMAWLYFEARLPEGTRTVRGLWVSSRFGLETIDGQENIVRVRDGRETGAMQFVATCAEGRVWARLDPPRAPAPFRP